MGAVGQSCEGLAQVLIETAMDKMTIKPSSLWHACIRGDLEPLPAVKMSTNAVPAESQV